MDSLTKNKLVTAVTLVLFVAAYWAIGKLTASSPSSQGWAVAALASLGTVIASLLRGLLESTPASVKPTPAGDDTKGTTET